MEYAINVLINLLKQICMSKQASSELARFRDPDLTLDLTQGQEIISSIMKEEFADDGKYVYDLLIFSKAHPLGSLVRLVAGSGSCELIKFDKIKFRLQINPIIGYHGTARDFKQAFETFVKPKLVSPTYNPEGVDSIFSYIQSHYLEILESLSPKQRNELASKFELSETNTLQDMFNFKDSKIKVELIQFLLYLSYENIR